MWKTNLLVVNRRFSVRAIPPPPPSPPLACHLRTKWPELISCFQHFQNKNGEFPLFNAPFPFQTTGTKDDENQAAVLVLLCQVNGESSLLFTRRSAKLRRHAAEISFPGGHVDSSDASFVDAALRETKEELLPADDFFLKNPIEILGQTTKLPSLRGTPVTPVIGGLFYELTKANIARTFPGEPKEVDEVFTVSIKRLLEVESSRELPDNRFRLRYGPVFPTEHGEIWGLTAYILRPLLHKLLRPVFVKQ
ncbi:hypothetical protein ACA910_018119 [Epithemia clementina (nom. ined.)]